ALEFANTNNLDIFTLGSGANILISDSGFDGLVIKPKLNKISLDNNIVTAESSVIIQDLIDSCLDNNIIGLEEFSLIPGTVGGSVYINIHYITHKFSDFLINAKIINKKTGQMLEVEKNWFEFGYDKSNLQKKEFFLISATFELKKVDDIKTAYAKGRRDEIIRHRKNRYPYSNTCGSFFRNFYPEEINFEINNKKITSVAYYLDKLGIKGELRVGNAIVSSQHANMIVTLYGAKSSDVLELAKKMQQLVFDKFGVKPVPECQIAGEDLWKFY
ncbi:UDP-N-acetylmuramate dehydrogenase, partial [Candidatus Babeliales bacterium]|nr:UDP-N-acetylmuramate dehydrogenase [Candidatus Babeliales bacterium]